MFITWLNKVIEEEYSNRGEESEENQEDNKDARVTHAAHDDDEGEDSKVCRKDNKHLCFSLLCFISNKCLYYLVVFVKLRD